MAPSSRVGGTQSARASAGQHSPTSSRRAVLTLVATLLALRSADGQACGSMCPTMNYFNGFGEVCVSAYASDLDCEWNLECGTGTPLLTFSEFSTEQRWDYVRVYDGSAPRGNLEIFDASGDLDTPFEIAGTGSQLLVRFTSDGSTSSDGFGAVFTCQGGGGDIQPPPGGGPDINPVPPPADDPSW